jgi:hypothetical protein
MGRLHFFLSRSSSWIIWNTFVAKSGSLGFLSGCQRLYKAWSSRFLVPGDDARNARISFRTDWKTCSCTSLCDCAWRGFSRGPQADAHRGRAFGLCFGSLYSLRSGCFGSSPAHFRLDGPSASGGFRGVSGGFLRGGGEGGDSGFLRGGDR